MRPLSFLLALCGSLAISFQGGDAGKKLPIPDQASQAKAHALVLDVFKEDIAAAQDPQAKATLALNLLQQGRDSRDDAAIRYVLFREAQVLASKGGNADLALRAVDEIVRVYEVNPQELKAAALAAVAENVTTAEASKAVVDLVLPLIGEAVEADNYPAALALGKVAETAARKSKNVALIGAVQKHTEEVAAIHKGFAQLQTFVDRLKTDPKNAEASLELGKYYAFFKGRWEKALPLLALGSDAALKSLAQRDLAQPKEGKDRLALADGWWDLAATVPEPAHLQLQRRAMFWYEQAMVQLTGLSRTKALKRIDKVSALVSGSSMAEGPAGPVGELKKFEGHTDEVKGVALSPMAVWLFPADSIKPSASGTSPVARKKKSYGVTPSRYGPSPFIPTIARSCR